MTRFPPTRSVGVGLVSVGWMGTVHSRAYLALPVIYPELGIKPRLIIAADNVQERADYAVNVLGYEESTLDYRAVLAHPDVEVVSICAPNFLHAEIGIAAAKSGKSFWIEKPVGRDAVETEAVQAAVVGAGVITTIGFNYRNAPAVEHAKKLIADGALGRITNVRGAFFADYSAEPKGALTWRFIRKFAGSGVLGDLMGHLVDLVQYLIGPIAEVSGITKTIHAERPILEMGIGTHFAVIENGKMEPVENEDYAGAVFRLADNALAAGAVGTIEASRVAVGPRASYTFEIYGTEGSIRWDFERMNEIEIAIGRQGEHVGYQRVMAGPGFGDFGNFHPGAGTSMGYDDLKIVEARKFLEAYFGGPAKNSNIHDAVSAARVVGAIEESAESKQWVKIQSVDNTTAAIKP